MYCTFCGRTMPDDCLFCSACGRQLGARVARRPLERAREGRKIAGVCMGFARHLDVDVTLIRLLTLVGSIFTGIGFIAYLIAWIVIPEEPMIVPQAQMVRTQSGSPVS
jgi:phage shock protein C